MNIAPTMSIAPRVAPSSCSDSFSTVTGNGYCIGCGGCAARPTGDARMAMSDIGLYEARLPPGGTAPDDFESICPFSGEAADEDMIADELFPERETRRHAEIGRYAACFVGHAEEGGFRRAGSSGGMASWLLCELLATGVVDGVVHVAAASDGALFRYRISTTPDAVRGGAKSRYYPVEASQVLEEIRETKGRFAFVGIPCFVKAVNLQRRIDATMRERIAVTVGIFCGHMKSARFAEFLAAQTGVAFDEVASVDFRLKYKDRPASSYGFEAIRRDGSRASKPMVEMFGGNWGYGLFKAKACGFCDDVTAETADIAFGDAWLTEHVNDPKGSNVVVVRDPALVSILTRAASAGRVRLAPVPADTIALSQAAGLRDRREGLSFRSSEKDAAGEWRPERRTPPSAKVPAKRREIYRLRDAITRASHSAFAATLGAKGAFVDFERALRPLIDAYDALYRPSWTERARRRAGRLARRLLDTVKRRART